MEVSDRFQDDVTHGAVVRLSVVILNSEELTERRGSCAGVGENGQSALRIDHGGVREPGFGQAPGLTPLMERRHVEMTLDWRVLKAREEHEAVGVHEGQGRVQNFPVTPSQLNLVQNDWRQRYH